jgi:hypothetical protein
MEDHTPSFDQYGSNIPRVPPPSPASSDDVKAAPIAFIHNNKAGKIRNRVRCVPTDSCEAFSAAIVIILIILGTSITMLATGVGNDAFAYSAISAILGMALGKVTKTPEKKPKKTKSTTQVV